MTELKHITLPDPNGENKNKLAFILENVFTPAECDKWIKLSHDNGYAKALINTGDGYELDLTVRNNDRSIVDDVDLALCLWDRIKPFIPNDFMGKKLLGINPRLRFLKYTGGEYFKPHYDGSYVAPNGSTSLITVQLYLKGDCTGGATRFLLDQMNATEYVDVEPTAGRVLVFEHDIYHEGCTVVDGIKYTVRTDIMYN